MDECSVLQFITFVFENTITMNVSKVDDVFVYSSEYAMKAAMDHLRRQLYEKTAAEIDLRARVKELEELLKVKQTESEADKNKIEALVKDVVDLRVHNDLLKADVRDCIAAHAGSGMDPDQIEARAAFAIANVDPPKRSAYDVIRDKFVKHGVYVPLYHDVDLSPGAPVGTGNGIPVADRNELHELLAAGTPVWGMTKRAPEGKENTAENRVKMYFPYSEIEAAQLAFEKLRPVFKPNPRLPFKTAAADVHHVDRSVPFTSATKHKWGKDTAKKSDRSDKKKSDKTGTKC